MTAASNLKVRAPLIEQLAQTTERNAVRRLRAILSDAFAAIRSAEANQALSAVTLEQLISDQIARNGESASSNAAQYNPYSYDPSAPNPAGEEPEERANFTSGFDLSRPTKLDRVLALQSEFDAAVEELKNTDPAQIADGEDYADAAADAADFELEEL